MRSPMSPHGETQSFKLKDKHRAKYGNIFGVKVMEMHFSPNLVCGSSVFPGLAQERIGGKTKSGWPLKTAGLF